jgi:methionyl-tRNA formyltransferase
MNVVFMGSPGFAVPSLARLDSDTRVVGVVSQPDRPAGRGRRLTPSSVTAYAIEHGLDLFRPESVNSPDSLEMIRGWQPEVIVVAAYGQILRSPLLELPPHGCLNVHASLLPRWRGASPIQAAILEGDDTTGITLMRMDVGMDTGPILGQSTIQIKPLETGGELAGRLAELGAKVLGAHLADILTGRTEAVPQNNEAATYAPLLKKKNGRLDFNQPADRLSRQVRAYEPWPASHFFWKSLRVVVRAAHSVTGGNPEDAGLVMRADSGAPVIQSVSGRLVLDLVQPAGKPLMDGASFLNGAPSLVGENVQTVVS